MGLAVGERHSAVGEIIQRIAGTHVRVQGGVFPAIQGHQFRQRQRVVVRALPELGRIQLVRTHGPALQRKAHEIFPG